MRVLAHRQRNFDVFLLSNFLQADVYKFTILKKFDFSYSLTAEKKNSSKFFNIT